MKPIKTMNGRVKVDPLNQRFFYENVWGRGNTFNKASVRMGMKKIENNIFDE